MPFDIVSGLILSGLAAVVWAVPPWASRWTAGALIAAAALGVVAARAGGGAAFAMDVAAGGLLIAFVLTVGRELLVHRRWPAGGFVAAMAVVTATGGYLRAYRLSSTIESGEPLQPDVRYYLDQARRTANPFAAGQKSPLWPALHAPLVRRAADPDTAMRMMSWSFGMLMIPAVALGLGKLFEPAVGVVVAGTLAVDSFLIDLCSKGLREEFGVCLWMALLVLLFCGTGLQPVLHRLETGATSKEPGHRASSMTWPRVIAAGFTAGVLLLLRNTDLPIVMVLVVYAVVRTRTGWPRALTGIALPLLVIAPFYVNQWRTYGDAFYLEKRDARYHANFEFMGKPAPAGLSMPSREEFDRDLYAGEPLSPAAYLFRYHTAGELAAYQWDGLKQVFFGQRFSSRPSEWLTLACAAGVLATLLIARQRFAGLFFFGSVLGIRAHLIGAMEHFEERHLLPVLVIWLAAGWWLIAAAVRAGVNRWLAFPRRVDTKTPSREAS